MFSHSGFAVADNMTFVGNDIFLFKKLPQIVRLEEIQEIFSCFGINGKGCLRFQELLIGAFPRREAESPRSPEAINR